MKGGEFVTFRKYLQLARLSNAFTAPSNVISGYLIVTPISELDSLNLVTLILSSTFLYVSGVIFNDYFDIEIDRKERPSRPLPSGSIPKQRAKKIAFGLMILAIILSLTVSWTSFAIAVFLSGIIIAYNYGLKHNKFSNPITMGSARFLNVILGASPAFNLSLQTNSLQLIFVAFSVLTYVFVIAVFSRKEMSGMQEKRQIIILFSIVYIVIVLITIVTLLGFFMMWSFIILVPFAIIVGIIFKQTLSGGSEEIRRGIKNMVISIIILDSIFVSGVAGLLYGFLTLLFLFPSILLSKKLYVT